MWTDAARKEHTAAGPKLIEGEQGPLTVTIAGATAVWNVAVACNRSTADYIISSPLFVNRYSAALPVFDDRDRA